MQRTVEDKAVFFKYMRLLDSVQAVSGDNAGLLC